MKPVASIIICTKNRAGSLRETLAKMEGVLVPSSATIEMIVVDNGSTDHTREIVECHQTNKYKLQYIWEPNGGQAHARNRGLSIAKSDIIVFTDDDVLPCEHWLEEHIRGYADDEIAAILGGIEALHMGPLPAEYSRESMDFSTRFGDKTVKPFTGHLVGANMSFRRTVIDAIGGFNARLGPGRSGFFDDTDFSIRLMRAGFIQCFEPMASVQHVIESSRLRAIACRRMLFQLGVSIFVADEFGASENVWIQTRKLLFSTAGFLKYKVKCLVKRESRKCTHVDLFYAMERGKMWARLQGRRRLERLYGPREKIVLSNLRVSEPQSL